MAQREGQLDQGSARAAGADPAGNPVDDAIRDAFQDSLGADKVQQRPAIKSGVDALPVRATAEGPRLVSDEVACDLVRDTMQRTLRQRLQTGLRYIAEQVTESGALAAVDNVIRHHPPDSALR